ncbi:2101_t:CDS:2, partial [Racocetra persica]
TQDKSAIQYTDTLYVDKIFSQASEYSKQDSDFSSDKCEALPTWFPTREIACLPTKIHKENILTKSQHLNIFKNEPRNANISYNPLKLDKMLAKVLYKISAALWLLDNVLKSVYTSKPLYTDQDRLLETRVMPQVEEAVLVIIIGQLLLAIIRNLTGKEAALQPSRVTSHRKINNNIENRGKTSTLHTEDLRLCDKFKKIETDISTTSRISRIYNKLQDYDTSTTQTQDKRYPERLQNNQWMRHVSGSFPRKHITDIVVNNKSRRLRSSTGNMAALWLLEQPTKTFTYQYSRTYSNTLRSSSIQGLKRSSSYDQKRQYYM